MIVGGLTFASALMKAPQAAFKDGGSRLAARVETQIATGNGFNPYPNAGENGKVPWARKED